MIPLGLSMALTVRIGESNGAGETASLLPIAISGWLLVSGYALLGATSFLFFGKWMAAAFTQDAQVIQITASLLVIVGVFQIVDGLQVASSAMLRGLHDARIPALMGFISYWIVGLPVGAGLAFGFDLGARGVWWGLAAGLFVACITLGPRLWNRSSYATSPL
jgi:MATE family multidrug resistance protein